MHGGSVAAGAGKVEDRQRRPSASSTSSGCFSNDEAQEAKHSPASSGACSPCGECGDEGFFCDGTKKEAVQDKADHRGAMAVESVCTQADLKTSPSVPHTKTDQNRLRGTAGGGTSSECLPKCTEDINACKDSTRNTTDNGTAHRNSRHAESKGPLNKDSVVAVDNDGTTGGDVEILSLGEGLESGLQSNLPPAETSETDTNAGATAGAVGVRHDVSLDEVTEELRHPTTSAVVAADKVSAGASSSSLAATEAQSKREALPTSSEPSSPVSITCLSVRGLQDRVKTRRKSTKRECKRAPSFSTSKASPPSLMERLRDLVVKPGPFPKLETYIQHLESQRAILERDQKLLATTFSKDNYRAFFLEKGDDGTEFVVNLTREISATKSDLLETYGKAKQCLEACGKIAESSGHRESGPKSQLLERARAALEAIRAILPQAEASPPGLPPAASHPPRL